MSTYLFDFDGTLVDSMPTYISAVLRVLDENNIKYENDVAKKITTLGFGGTAATSLFKYLQVCGIMLVKVRCISCPIQNSAHNPWILRFKS